MVSYFGKSFELNRVVENGTYTHYELGGRPIRATPTMRGDVYKEPVTGTRALDVLKQTGVVPGFDWTMNLKVLTDYITTYAMVTAEGAIPAHSLGFTDGVESNELKLAKVDRCNIVVRRGESVKAELSAIGEDLDIFVPATFLHKTEEPIMWTDVVLAIDGGVTNWREFGFGVNNNVVAEFLGTGLVPTDVEELQAEYFGHVIISRKTTSRFSGVKGGDAAIISVALTDHQTVPVTKTFTFAAGILKTSRIEVAGLGLELERIEWEAPGLVITP